MNYQLSFLFIFICLSFIKLGNFAALAGTLFRTFYFFTPSLKSSSNEAPHKLTQAPAMKNLWIHASRQEGLEQGRAMSWVVSWEPGHPHPLLGLSLAGSWAAELEANLG